MTWTYLTLERTRMNTWTRKRRLKFRKRYRKQHNGEKFRWFCSEFKYVPLQREDAEMIDMIFFKRDPTGPLGMKIKEG